MPSIHVGGMSCQHCVQSVTRERAERTQVVSLSRLAPRFAQIPSP